MNLDKLTNYLKNYKTRLKKDENQYLEDQKERRSRVEYYQEWDKNKISAMTQDDFEEYFSQLWAMRIWGNKKYATDKIIQNNGLDNIKKQLNILLWSSTPIQNRWDSFMKSIKGVGPAMVSELLCLSHPKDYVIWNKRALIGLKLLGVSNLPVYNYQCTGKKYLELISIMNIISEEMEKEGIKDNDFLSVDYFIWYELQEKITTTDKIVSDSSIKSDSLPDDNKDDFIHNEIRDKLANIGRWLGFNTDIEKKVAAGAKVDTIWEATIGNMGRIIYIFEVQTKGSIDSLLVNLLKSLNNPAVQGIVAVSDDKQIEKIKQQAEEIPGLRGRLKMWNYKEVLDIHDSLEVVNETINNLGLVPQGF